MTEDDFSIDASDMSDHELVEAIMGDHMRKENIRAAMINFMRMEHPVKWAYSKDTMIAAVNTVIDNPNFTPELIAACRAMYPARHAPREMLNG